MFACSSNILCYSTGWAGNLGGTECACGELGTCPGGPDAACECDMNDDVERFEEGVLVDKTVLPISQICFGYSENNSTTRKAGYLVQEFNCRPWQGGGFEVGGGILLSAVMPL